MRSRKPPQILLRTNRAHLPSLGNRIAGIAFLLGCCVLFNGCVVVFTDPLPGWHGFTANPELLGRWRGKDEHGNVGILQFEKAGSRDIAVSLFGEDSDLGYRNPIFKLRTTKIGRFDYMVLSSEAWAPYPYYMIARYSLEKDKLKIWMSNVAKFREAVVKGQLKGKSSANSFSVTVNSSSRHVVRVLNGPQSDDLFYFLGEYEKITK